MIPGWAAVLAALVYICFLFAIAHWGDVSGRPLLEGRWRGTIYALTLAVYCTSWTFYGSVGFASRSGLDFLAIYVGPILVIALGHALVGRVLRIAKTQNTTSVADFVAARYGKSESVAAMVSLIALIGSIPYIALQLKAVSASLAVMLTASGSATAGSSVPIVGDLALATALVLGGFSLAFGTRQADATEHQDGLVVAIAVESVVKLVAFLGVGFFVIWGLSSALEDVPARIAEALQGGALFGEGQGTTSFLTMLLLSAAAALLLPRQFHMTVVENRAPEDVRRAAWLFPLYLLLINLFVLPLALAGFASFPDGAIDRDMTVLALPLKEGSGMVALMAFLGGLSAATAMVIVDTIAVAIMVSNHLVMPLVLRRRGLSIEQRRRGGLADVGGFVLGVRRVAIMATVLLGYVYYRMAGDAALASIGLLSFAAIAQIAPAFFGGLFWARGTAWGAMAGLAVGLAIWAYTLLLPSLVPDLLAWPGFRHGPFAAFRPTGLFGTDLPELAHGVVWSLCLNALTYIGFSLLRPANALERLQAASFVGAHGLGMVPAFRFLRTSVSVEDLRATVARYLGEERTNRSFAAFAREHGASLDPRAGADIQLLSHAEHLLASAIGAASSRLALSLLLRRRNLSKRAALKLLDDASAAIEHDRNLLQHALDHARQGITVVDRELRILCWNRGFVDLYSLPPDLIRVGTGLEEVLRLNAERGSYGPGAIEDHIAARLRSLLHDTEPVRLRLYPFGRVIEIRSNNLPDGGIVTTYTDVTELVLEEEARERTHETLEVRVRERTEELTRLNAALTHAKREAEEANLSKTRFLAAASHDILQPLNAARLYATSLVERTHVPEEAAIAENVDASLDAVEEILTTLLDISRLDSGVLKPNWTVVSLDPLLRQLQREFEPLARRKGLALTFVPASLSVRTDRQLLRRLLQNLISNAIKYTPSGRVLVGVRRRGTRVRVEVRDTGLGIPQAKHDSIFEEFHRLDKGTRVASGLGLGLSIVQRIARVLNLPLTLASEPGRGSTFRIELPRAEAAREEASESRGREAARPLVQLAVLTIDNEPAILDGMRILLSGWGCRVTTARGIREAIDAVRAGAPPPEVIIADYHLDEGNGLDGIDLIRRSLGMEVPAILVTADASAGVRASAQARRVHVLGKPLKPAALRALLSQWRNMRVAAE